MKKFIVFIVSLCFYISGWSLNQPSIRCLEVKDNGDVLVSWVAPTDNNGFLRFEIYSATDPNATFTKVGTITSIYTTQFLHAGANAVQQPNIYYYVKAVGNSASYDSETLSTIEFYLSNSGTGIAILNWSSPTESDMPTYASQYDVWKSYPNDSWTQRMSINSFIFRDTIDVCDAMIGYRVSLTDESGCRNVSRIQRERFTDMTSPDIPQLDSVSVDLLSQKVHLGWKSSDAPDAYAYIIYYFDNNMWLPIDTVYGISNTEWTDAIHDPQNNSLCYRIATLDSCLNSSPMTDLQQSMTLTSTFDLCRREAYLSWSEYQNMEGGLGLYQIFCSVDGGSWQYVGNAISGTYTYSGLINNHNYRFHVKAVNTNESIKASSIVSSFQFSSADNHDFVYVRSVSVNEMSETIDITVYTGPTVSFTKVHLYRSVGDGTHFSKIMTLGYNGTDTYVFSDAHADYDHQLYYYKASIENECDMETAESNISHNILLIGTTNAAHMNSLGWNNYEGWNGGVSSYVVKRITEASPFETDLITTALPSCVDDVSELTREGSRFTYCVMAQESDNEYGFSDQSRSNKVALIQAPTIFVPNAFCPSGVNTVFLPVSTFMPNDEYYMAIYSREGQQIFYTTDPNKGWDGYCQGKEAPGGVYVFKIKYLYDGNYFEKSGTVTLVY